MLTTSTIERVHDPENGRIDAFLVARLLDLKLSQLARVLGENYETLRKNPCREEAQTALASLAHAWNQLELIFADDGRIARWLHHPMAGDGRRPLDVLTAPNGLEEFTRLVGRIATGTYR